MLLHVQAAGLASPNCFTGVVCQADVMQVGSIIVLAAIFARFDCNTPAPALNHPLDAGKGTGVTTANYSIVIVVVDFTH